MIVNIEEIKGIDLRIKQINSVDLADIEFMENGKKLDIPKSLINEFKFMGLCNHSFINMGIYLEDELAFAEVAESPK